MVDFHEKADFSGGSIAKVKLGSFQYSVDRDKMIMCLLRQSLECLGCSQSEGRKRFGKTVGVLRAGRSTVPHAIQVDIVEFNDHRTV
ncbi:hypothetical protein D3C85_1547170 [compost metagenome]